MRAGQRRLALGVSQELFSSHTIDTGTLRLFKSLDGMGDVPSALDVGCGYGPLALGLRALSPGCAVEAVDRDALAVRYTAMNADANALAGDDLSVHGSLGYDDVNAGRRFDLVVSNVPGKAPEALHAELIAGAARHLVAGGVLAIVVVTPLTPLVDGILEGVGAEVTHRSEGAQHTVFHARFTEAMPPASTSGFDRGIYQRGTVDGVRTVHGIAEFDQLGFHTVAALRLVAGGRDANLGERLIVVNPGQGHVAVAAASSIEAGDVVLADRDLLALRTTATNLGDRPVVVHHVPLLDGVDLGTDAALGVVVLRPKEPGAVHVHHVETVLAAAERVIVSGTATTVTRLVKHLGLQPARTERHRGHLAIELSARA